MLMPSWHFDFRGYTVTCGLRSNVSVKRIVWPTQVISNFTKARASLTLERRQSSELSICFLTLMNRANQGFVLSFHDDDRVLVVISHRPRFRDLRWRRNEQELSFLTFFAAFSTIVKTPRAHRYLLPGPSTRSLTNLTSRLR